MTSPRQVWRIIPGDPEIRSTVLGEFIRGDYISIGWNIGDISGMSDSEIRQRLEEWKKEKGLEFNVGHGLRMLKVFRDEMREGDIVIVSADGFIYAIGEIISPYYYREHPTFYYWYRGEVKECVFPYKRRVRWLRITKLPHSELPEDVRRALGRPPTIVKIELDLWERLSRVLLSP